MRSLSCSPSAPGAGPGGLEFKNLLHPTTERSGVMGAYLNPDAGPRLACWKLEGWIAEG